jgi:ribosomal-protein-serine acetyltransferase
MFQLRVNEGVELRQFELADAEPCFESVDRNRASLREWLPWVDRTHSPADILDFLRKRAIPQYQARNGPSCGIWVGGQFAGSLGCHPIDWPNRSCALGYWLDERFRGRGLMTDCCAAFTDYLFRELKLHRIAVRCATGNHRSCAIPQRLGFRQEGIELEAEWVGGRWVDLLNWGILEHEWRRSASR